MKDRQRQRQGSYVGCQMHMAQNDGCNASRIRSPEGARAATEKRERRHPSPGPIMGRAKIFGEIRNRVRACAGGMHGENG